MRSASEIAFRLRQELANAVLYWRAPVLPNAVVSALPLPDPQPVAERLADSPFRHELRAVVDLVLSGRIPALGLTVAPGPDIHWRRDYTSGIETPPLYFRRIPYLDVRRCGDHKVIWEINRHQHLVALAQELLFVDAAPGAEAELIRQLESWLEANPFQRGVNWCSALEVAFRALSWIWIYHFAGSRFPAPLQQRFLTALYQHGLHLEYNLSKYFSPNTHLLGEAVALHALGTVFPQWPRARSWTAAGSRIVLDEMDRQVRDDGSHFEQSAYYHLYATDMFLFHGMLARPGGSFPDRLARMAEFLDHILGPSRRLPMLGDDDGGRFFHPFGDRHQWPSQTLAACAVYLKAPQWKGTASQVAPLAAWWFGAGALEQTGGPAVPTRLSSRLFPQSGLATLLAGETQVIADAGGFGPGSAGHSHSDALSLIVRRGDEEILIDPATYTYIGDPLWRDRFRGSAAHNTVRIDGQDQAVAAGPFRWVHPPAVEVRHWSTSPAADILEAACRYGGCVHLRRIIFVKPDLVLIMDRVESAAVRPPELSQHHVEWFWHPGQPAQLVSSSALSIRAGASLVWDQPLEATYSEAGDYGWRSPALGVKEPAGLLRLSFQGPLPARLTTILDLSGQPADGGAPSCKLERDVVLYRSGKRQVRIDPATGAHTQI